ncbi:TIGR01440 family protein [Clostridia bacterium]|nr:TIGR01440 family protein [Clostridia bacterium]
MDNDFERSIVADTTKLVQELIEVSALSAGDLLVIGCSTSEIDGSRIGKKSVPEYGKIIIEAVMPLIKKHGIHLATQCCEHLNRALVVEAEYAASRELERVTVVPHPKAGGSLSSAYYRYLKNPAMVETIAADAGIDIGDTLIGMHLKRVAIPLRLSVKSIGAAHVTAAKTRPKLIGGERAKYDI